MSRLFCSFCDKNETDVRQIVAGPNRVAVCNECVELFADFTQAGFKESSLITGIGELVTNDPQVPGLLGIIENAALATVGGVVRWAGPADAIPIKYRDLPSLDVGGRAVMPGFVDPHTHILYGGDRADDFAEQLAHFSTPPLTAVEDTVQATAATSDAHLERETAERMDSMLRHGTTTIEVKSGYGQTVAAERRLLQVLDTIADSHSADIVPTLLFRSVPATWERPEYVEMILEELIPLCSPLATYIDVYCDETGFTADEAAEIISVAHRYGLPSRLHAERFGPDQSVLLAATARSVSADHLDHITRGGAERLAAANTVAVALPAASFGTRAGHTPVRMLWDAGVTVALGSDCGPEGLAVESMQLIVALATIEMGLTSAQAIWAATRGGALAVEEPEKGWLGRGAIADFVVLDAPRSSHLVQRPGINLAWHVVKDGVTVATAVNSEIRPSLTRK